MIVFALFEDQLQHPESVAPDGPGYGECEGVLA